MRILLPLNQSAGGGIARVLEGLLRSLPQELPRSDELILVGEPPLDVALPDNVRVASSRRVEGRIGRLFEQQARIPALARDADLIHLGDFRPVLASRTDFVITVHDVTFLDAPEWYPLPIAKYKRALLSAALVKKPAAIVCVSEFTRRRLLVRHPEASRHAIRVIYPGVSVAGEAARRNPSSRTEDRYFLTVSAIEPRKNHLTLLRALFRAREMGFSLRWKVVGAVGYKGESIGRALVVAEGVDVLGRVSDDELERLYAEAEFVATPSHEEGFGFPPLEAMLRGVPTVTSLGSALDETVGDASYRVAATDVDGWVTALTQLSSEPELRDQLVSKGLERVKRFSHGRSAVDYVSLYHQISDA